MGQVTPIFTGRFLLVVMHHTGVLKIFELPSGP